MTFSAIVKSTIGQFSHFPSSRRMKLPDYGGTMKLYYYPLSGHAHRAALFLSLLGLEHELIDIDLAAGAHRQREFLALNTFGEVPVLDDGGVVIADSLAILVYLARKTGPTHWLPDNPIQEAEVQRWLSVAAGKIAYGACAARLVTVFGAKFDAEEVIARAHARSEEHTSELQSRENLVCRLLLEKKNT